MKIVSKTAYKLKLPENLRVHPVFHVSQLERYHDPKAAFPGRHVPFIPPIEVDDVLEYEVEAVLDDHRTRKYRCQIRSEYLEYLGNAQELVKRYHDVSRTTRF